MILYCWIRSTKSIVQCSMHNFRVSSFIQYIFHSRGVFISLKCKDSSFVREDLVGSCPRKERLSCMFTVLYVYTLEIIL